MSLQALVSLAKQNRSRIGLVSGLVAAASYGLSQMVSRRVVTETAPPLVTTAFALMFGLIFLSILFHRSLPGDIDRAPKRAWLFMVLAGLASTWGVLFLFFALSKSPVVLVSPATSINPLITMTLSHLFLQRLEKVTLRLVIGTLMIIGGATIIAVSASL